MFFYILWHILKVNLHRMNKLRENPNWQIYLWKIVQIITQAHKKKFFSVERMPLWYSHVFFSAETESVTFLTPARQDYVLTSKNTSKNH